METVESEAYITIRNLIQSKYNYFRPTTADEIQQLKQLSTYPRSLVAHEIERCVNDRVTVANLLNTLLYKMKSLQKPPTPTEVDEFYQRYQSNTSHRCLELLDSGFSYDEMKSVIYAVLETMHADGIVRIDRPLPTDPKAQWQIKLIEDMNRSDSDYLDRIDTYKNECGADHIPLSTIQQEWLIYINCESDVKPERLISDIPIGVTNITTTIDNNDIPF